MIPPVWIEILLDINDPVEKVVARLEEEYQFVMTATSSLSLNNVRYVLLRGTIPEESASFLTLSDAYLSNRMRVYQPIRLKEQYRKSDK